MPSSFRIQAKNFFLTYSQCPVDKQELFDHFKTLYPDIKELVVAHEEHKDHGSHLHCFLGFTSTLNVTKETFFDYKGFHPNLQKAKSVAAVIKYCTKEDDYLSHGVDLKLKASAVKQHRTELQIQVAKSVLAGTLTREMVESDPMSLYYLDSASKGLRALECLETRALPRCTGTIPSAQQLDWAVTRTRKRHQWLWSTHTATGKTTTARLILKKHPGFFFDYASSFQDGVKKGDQFVILDEYSSHPLAITQLNQMCDGTWHYQRKGLPALVLDDPVIIVVGNKAPEELYSHKFIEFIESRFTIIELTEPLGLDADEYFELMA